MASLIPLLPLLVFLGMLGINDSVFVQMSYISKLSRMVPNSREENSNSKHYNYQIRTKRQVPQHKTFNETFEKLKKGENSNVSFYPVFLTANNVEKKSDLNQFSVNRRLLTEIRRNKQKKTFKKSKISKRSQIKKKKKDKNVKGISNKIHKSTKRMEMFVVDESQLDETQPDDSQLDDGEEDYVNEESDEENSDYNSDDDLDFKDINRNFKFGTIVNTLNSESDYSNLNEANYPQYIASSKPSSTINSEPVSAYMVEGLSTPFMESTQLIKANQMRGNYISVGNYGNKKVDQTPNALDKMIKKEAFKAQIDNSIKEKIFEDIAKDAALRDEFAKNITELDFDLDDYSKNPKEVEKVNKLKEALFSFKMSAPEDKSISKDKNLSIDSQNSLHKKPGYSYLVLPGKKSSKTEEDVVNYSSKSDQKATVSDLNEEDTEPAAVGDFANIVEKADQEVINSSLKFQKYEKQKIKVDADKGDGIFEEPTGYNFKPKIIFSPTPPQLNEQDKFVDTYLPSRSDPLSLQAVTAINHRLSLSQEQSKQETEAFNGLEQHSALTPLEDEKKFLGLDSPTKIFVSLKDSSDHSIAPTDQLLEMLSKGQFNHPLSDADLAKLSSFDPNKQYEDEQNLSPPQFSQNNVVHFGGRYAPANVLNINNPQGSHKLPYNPKPFENSPKVVKTDPSFLGQNLHLLDPSKFRTFDDLNKISEGMIHAHVVSIKQPSQKHNPMHNFLHIPNIDTHFQSQRVFEDALETPYIENEKQDIDNGLALEHLHKFTKAVAKNHCHASPCQNGGQCTPHPHGYRCSCKLGWIGETCHKRSSCNPNPCVHGTCSPNADGHSCTCKLGFKGQQCEVVDRCHPNPCSNNGICAETKHKVQCECLPGFKGSLCQLEEKCAPINPCLNGGICHELFAHYHCECTSMFHGQNCEILLAPTKPPGAFTSKHLSPQAIPIPTNFLFANTYPTHSEAFDNLPEWETLNKNISEKALKLIDDKDTLQEIDKKRKDYSSDKNQIKDNQSNQSEIYNDMQNKSAYRSNSSIYNKERKTSALLVDNKNKSNGAMIDLQSDSSFEEKLTSITPDSDQLLERKVSNLFDDNKNSESHAVKKIDSTAKTGNKKEEGANVRTFDLISKSNFLTKNLSMVDVSTSKNYEHLTNQTAIVVENIYSNANLLKNLQRNPLSNPHPSDIADKLKRLDKRVFKNDFVGDRVPGGFTLKGFSHIVKVPFQVNGKQRSLVDRKPNLSNQNIKSKNVYGQTRLSQITKQTVRPFSKIKSEQFQIHKQVAENSFYTSKKYGCPEFCQFFCDPWCIKVGCCKGSPDQINLFKEIEREHLVSFPKACINCNENADCVNNRCVCKTGFHGNGISCAVDICVLCHLDADCIKEKCFCKHGYHGDGYECKRVVDNRKRCQMCHTNAQCVNGVCTCLKGFYGNDRNCWPLPII